MNKLLSGEERRVSSRPSYPFVKEIKRKNLFRIEPQPCLTIESTSRNINRGKGVEGSRISTILARSSSLETVYSAIPLKTSNMKPVAVVSLRRSGSRTPDNFSAERESRELAPKRSLSVRFKGVASQPKLFVPSPRAVI